ncbi:hypothetical protein CY35_03G066500 [Sphagnum magellanicum]|nr:hypothetical protein CY35_03G066500 [Sphagnum magellanicum]
MLLFCIRSPSVQVLGGSRCAGRCGGLLARETLAQTDLYYIVVNVVQHSTPTGSFTNACKLLPVGGALFLQGITSFQSIHPYGLAVVLYSRKGRIS